jgi:RNA polymerase sigma-70 factor (ECF subfamily)
MTSDAEFEAIYNEYKDLVYNLALHYVQQAADGQDLTQDIFIKIFRKLHQYDPATASLKTWICRITINHCLDVIKARKTKKRFGFIIGLFHRQSNEPLSQAGTSGHPGIAAEDKEEITFLFSLINALPPHQRTAIILTRIEDRSQKEAAEIMNISVKALESLLQRAKQTLSKKMNR